MGASWFTRTSYGKTIKDAYDIAVEQAEEEYGQQDGYNGTISTTYGVTDLTKEYKKSKKDLNMFIDLQAEKLHKRQCAAICVQEPVGNKNKIKSEVEHIVTSGTRKWLLEYVVRNNRGRYIGSYRTKGHAVQFARKHTEETQISTTIIIQQRLITGPPTVAEIKYKKSTSERPGKWIFFGWAAE